MSLRGLTILIPTDDRVRFRAALSLACAHSALGGRVRLFCQEEAASLLVDAPDPDATALIARGLPTIDALIAAAHDTGVALIACQTGLAAANLSADALFAAVETGGLVGVLATLENDRLVTA